MRQIRRCCKNHLASKWTQVVYILLVFKAHCYIYYSTCTRKYGFDRFDGAEIPLCNKRGRRFTDTFWVLNMRCQNITPYITYSVVIGLLSTESLGVSHFTTYLWRESVLCPSWTFIIGATLFQGIGINHLKGTHYKRILWNIRSFAD